jgi:hypothetical protein
MTKKEIMFTKKKMLMNDNEDNEGEEKGVGEEEEGLFILKSKRINWNQIVPR